MLLCFEGASMGSYAYSLDLLERVLADRDEGMSKASVARKYRVSTRWIYNLEKRREQTGQIAPRRGKTSPQPKLAEHGQQLLELVEEQPDASLRELRDRPGVAVCVGTVHNALRWLGVTFKKGAARR